MASRFGFSDGAFEVPGRANFEAFIGSWIDTFDRFHLEVLDIFDRGRFWVVLVPQSGRGRISGAETSVELSHVWEIENDIAVGYASYDDLESAFAAVAAAERS